jgi:beta-lactamase superfamily II metal-dependent hydrolase
MKSELSITLIDVGWGDSIFLESRDHVGNTLHALIDSNDTTYLRSSYIFLKRYFEKKSVNPEDQNHIFEFIILTHAHADHGQGIKALFRAFGTKNFWYPKSLNWSSMVDLLRYSNRSNRVVHHQSIDSSKLLPDFGDVKVEILWPHYNQIHGGNENNNSVVLLLNLNNVSFILTGDAEKEVWTNIAHSIPPQLKFFKVPHHGSVNGTFDNHSTPWLDRCPKDAILGISSHVRPFNHPDQEVIELLENNKREYYRTDEHYHITIWTDGDKVEVKYSHV